MCVGWSVAHAVAYEGFLCLQDVPLDPLAVEPAFPVGREKREKSNEHVLKRSSDLGLLLYLLRRTVFTSRTIMVKINLVNQSLPSLFLGLPNQWKHS